MEYGLEGLLLELDIERMKDLALQGSSVRAIAREMGISKSLVHKVLNS